MKFEKCPICGKKGLYVERSHFHRRLTCRYCKASWATHSWSMTTYKNTDVCPKCGYKELGNANMVFPHFEPMSEEHVLKRIEQEKARYTRKNS